MSSAGRRERKGSEDVGGRERRKEGEGRRKGRDKEKRKEEEEGRRKKGREERKGGICPFHSLLLVLGRFV